MFTLPSENNESIYQKNNSIGETDCKGESVRIGYEPDKNQTRIGKNRVRFWRKTKSIKSNN